MEKRKELVPLVNASLIYSSNVDRLDLVDHLTNIQHNLKAVREGATREDYEKLNHNHLVAFQPNKWQTWETVLTQLIKFANANKIVNMKMRYKGEERKFFSTNEYNFEITDNETKTVYSINIKGDTYESQVKTSN